MAITVKKIEIWNAVVDNRPGALASVLEPLAAAGADLEIVMGTSIPGMDGKASIGIYPIKGRKLIAAARAAGLEPAASMPSLLVVGDNRPGLGGRMSEALANAGINIGVAVAQVVGPHFSALFGFASQEDATKATALLKKVAAAAKPPATAGQRTSSAKTASSRAGAAARSSRTSAGKRAAGKTAKTATGARRAR